jgi:hypothetical protein
MELTQIKPGLRISFYKMVGNVGVPILGIMALLIVALQFWRAPGCTSSLRNLPARA